MANAALLERIKDGTRLPPPAPEPDDDYEEIRRADLRRRLTAAGVPLIELPGSYIEGAGKRDILSDLAYEIEVYLRGLNVAQLVCLTYGHRWPELVPVPGMKVPKGFRAVPAPERDGAFLITEACTRLIIIGRSKESCGTSRSSRTLPAGPDGIRGIFDRKHMRQYAYDSNEWEKRPEGSRLTRIDFLQEIYRRMSDELFTAEYEEEG